MAVYSPTDADAMHVALADQSVALAGNSPAETYLDGKALIAAALTAGADAIHPGYGFLAENASFAQGVADAGLTWIGPSADAISALGDKLAARRIAAMVGAPLLASSDGPVGSVEEARAFVARAGLPVIIKAQHGGGGRGMRVVRDLADLERSFDSARREAKLSFGNDECFIERFLDNARHVETQCLADAYGNVAVLSTRDCSVQRRQQKLIEEAPAPFLTDLQVRALTKASKGILSAAGYSGAGTCEFLVGADGEIAFLEVNTRVQVEHPVTEEVTGIDIIREMFEIAAGGRLSTTEPKQRGHSIEFRINAEDPAQGFRPTPGHIAEWKPAGGPGIRLDAGYGRGQSVPPNYDSLIAKLIVTGRDRQQALERAQRALAEFEIEGLPTTLGFHRAVVVHPDFVGTAGSGFRVHTKWVDELSAEFLQGIERQGHAFDAARAGRGAGSLARPSIAGPSRNAATKAAKAPGEITAPMTGTVIAVEAKVGARIEKGDIIVILEAMKMENLIVATAGGTVNEMALSVGDTVSIGDTICVLTLVE